MRKTMLMVLMALLLALWLGAASADTFVMDALFASVEIPAEEFPIILEPDTLSEYAEWLDAQGKSMEDVSNDMLKRGVLMQCWNNEGDLCFELTASQSQQTEMVFDVNEQSEAVRREYRLSHSPRNVYSAMGYDFTSANWKNVKSGRFLVLDYIRRDAGEVLYRGLMRRTIRNGYEITLDLQVFGRSATSKDTKVLDKIWNTFQFIEVKPMPPIASAQISLSKTPPEETNEPSFALEGTAAEGVKLTAVVMGLTYPDPMLFDAVVGSAGKFKLPITLPKEGVFLITVTGEYQGEDVIELAYPVTYQRMLLAVNVTSEVPETLTTSELTIEGYSVQGASIQAFQTGEAVQQKRVGGEGKFTVKFKIDEEGPCEVALVFSKKDLTDRRVVYTVNRKWTDEDMLTQLEKQAIKPGYLALIKKMKEYEGRVMGYRAYLVSVNKSGEDWIAQMALTKDKGAYGEMIVVVCSEEPTFRIGDRVMMYGTCVGMSLGVSNEDDVLTDTGSSYPCFDLLLLAAL